MEVSPISATFYFWRYIEKPLTSSNPTMSATGTMHRNFPGVVKKKGIDESHSACGARGMSIIRITLNALAAPGSEPDP